MIFQLKKLYLLLKIEIVLCWESKIIIDFSNGQIPESDPDTVLHLIRSDYDDEEALKALKEALESIQDLCRITHCYE